MKLNFECVRDLLLEIEEIKTYKKDLRISDLHNLAVNEKYSYEDIEYSLLKLKQADFLKVTVTERSNSLSVVSVGNITWSGHEFLDNVRDNETWSKVKDIASKGTNMSITLMGKLAFQYLAKKFSLI
ncbi:DUF2513 domain-containing protein [Staphylococcus nepalensis]|uniref:DUF2513 domain-containing protein n=1 Tax=Staphylococcus nepalensis TaxID=214473 RepID=UPI003CF6B9DD